MHHQNKPNIIIVSYSTFVIHHESISFTKIPLEDQHILAWNFFTDIYNGSNLWEFEKLLFPWKSDFYKQLGESPYLQYSFSVTQRQMKTKQRRKKHGHWKGQEIYIRPKPSKLPNERNFLGEDMGSIGSSKSHGNKKKLNVVYQIM